MNACNLKTISIAGFALIMAFLLGLLGLSYRYMNAAMSYDRLVWNTNLRIQKFDRLLSDLKDVESGARGFALTGRESFLDPYHQALNSIDGDLSDLQRFIPAGSAQWRRLESIKGNIREKIANSVATVEQRRTIGFKAAAAAASCNMGQAAMDAIRDSVGRAKQDEEALLRLHTDAKIASERGYLSLNLTATGLSMALIAAVFLLFNAELKRRMRMESSLLEYQEHLSDMVKSQTRELRENERRLSAIFNGVTESIWLLDLDGRVLAANETAAQRLGMRVADVVGRDMFGLLPPAIGEARKRHILEMTESNGPVRFEDDRAGITFDHHYYPVRDAQGAIVQVAIFSTDITVRKQLEDSLRIKTANLELANEDLEAFIFSVTHDLRTPLTVIKGFSDTLAKMYAEKIDDQGREFLVRISDSVRKIDTIIDDLMVLFRISYSEMKRERFNLAHLAAAIVAEFRLAQPEREVTFTADERLVADADPNLMKIALTNLLSNAWKFTAKTEAARIELADCSEPGKRVFCLKDNGAGFDMAKAARLFKPFQRLHSTQEFPGTGIGLAIVQRVIRRHGGAIWATGQPGKGSVFYFTLE